MKSKQRGKTENPVWNSVKTTLKQNPAACAVMIFCIFGSVITSLIPPLVLERGVDRISAGNTIPVTLAILYLLMIVTADLFESAQGVSITVLGQKITRGLRTDLCRKLSRLPADYFTAHDSGNTASVFVNDADTIDSLYSDGIVGMIADSFKIISILIIIFTKSPGLGLLLLVITPFLFQLTMLFQRRTLAAQTDNRKAIARVNNHVPETIRNIRMIHVFGREAYMEDKYEEGILESYEAVNRSNIYDSIYSPIILTTQALVIAVMMIAAVQGSGMQKFFGLTIGSAVAVIAYVGKIFSPLESLGMEIQNIQSAVSGIKRIREFLELPELPELPEPGADKEDQANMEDICFSDVTFGYTPDRTVLEHLTFCVKEGAHVTFMGRTGSGKSTIFRLLTGLYRPDEGQVLLAGRRPETIGEEEKRRIYGIVEQKFAPVPGTIRDQLTLFDPTITEETVCSALQLTGLWKTVEKMPEKLDTPMKEGLFSQGQLQLLAIARAVVTSPGILLLDEITANLDSTTEEQILAALKSASEGRTVLSISHRYSDALKEEQILTLG